jgi:ech hydrogenase subunit D
MTIHDGEDSEMSERQEIELVEKSDLVGLVARYFAEGWRLVQIGCSTLPEGYEITYSFARDTHFRNLRILVAPQEEVPSVSVIYPNAFLYENELQDLFGVPVANLDPDYRGNLYRTAVPTPFSIDNVQLPAPPRKQAAKQNPDSVSGRPEEG